MLTSRHNQREFMLHAAEALDREATAVDEEIQRLLIMGQTIAIMRPSGLGAIRHIHCRKAAIDELVGTLQRRLAFLVRAPMSRIRDGFKRTREGEVIIVSDTESDGCREDERAPPPLLEPETQAHEVTAHCPSDATATPPGIIMEDGPLELFPSDDDYDVCDE